jgi:hypothetical protein
MPGKIRRSHVATLGVMAGMFIAAGGSSGAAVAHASRAQLLAATATCATPPVVTAAKTSHSSGSMQAATVDDALLESAASPSATASPTPTATAAASTTPSTSPSATATPDPSPTASATTSPTPTLTPTPTQSPKPKPKTPQLCVQVKPFSSSDVHPGATASYKVLVWSTNAESLAASVTVSVGNAAHVNAPTFSVCPQAKNDVCTVGDLLTTQSEELIAAAKVGTSASVGEKVTLTATVTASKATSFHAAATIDVVSPSTPTPSASATPPASSSVGDSLPGASVSGLGLTSPSNPSGLFPTVSPAGTAKADKSNRTKNAPDASTVSAVLPLDSRLIGGQLIGLVVLASAIAIAIARLSLRAPRPQDGGKTSS